jgi:hypothetical protein
MKTMLNYVGIKTQDTSMPTAAPSTSTTSDYNPTSYSAPSSSYSQQSNLGMATGVHYIPPRDIQNRKAL